MHPSDPLYKARLKFKHNNPIKRLYLQGIPYYERSPRFNDPFCFLLL
jgi:hypothetical protein